MKLGILIYFIVLFSVNSLVNAYLHGKERTGKYNIFYNIIANSLFFLLPLLLLYFAK